MSLQSLEKLEEKLESLQFELAQAYWFELPKTQNELKSEIELIEAQIDRGEYLGYQMEFLESDF